MTHLYVELPGLYCSGVFAAVTLAVHIKYFRDQWATGANCLRALMLLGCLAQLASVCAFAVYLALAISEHQCKSAIIQEHYITNCNKFWCSFCRDLSTYSNHLLFRGLKP